MIFFILQENLWICTIMVRVGIIIYTKFVKSTSWILCTTRLLVNNNKLRVVN